MLTMNPMVDQPPTKALMKTTLRSFQRRNKIQKVFVAMICEVREIEPVNATIR